MKYEEIIKLLDAGYSRDEILNMEENPNDNIDDNKDPDTDTEENPNDLNSVYAEMKDMFAEMKKEITAMNILSSRQPSEKARTSEDIIATIINPTKKGDN